MGQERNGIEGMVLNRFRQSVHISVSCQAWLVSDPMEKKMMYVFVS